MILNMFLGQPCCICIDKEDNFDLKGSETDVTGIPLLVPCCRSMLLW